MSRTRKRRHNKYYPKNKSRNKKPTFSYNLSRDITKDKTPEVKRNTFGDVIYSMQYVGDEKFEYWVDYDENRRPISYKDTRGHSWNCTYNGKGNISLYWDNSGYQEEYRYYARNLVICTTSYGEKIKKKVNNDKFITRDVFIQSDDYI